MSSSFDELFDKNKEKMSKSRFQDDDLDDFMASERPKRDRRSRNDYYDDYDDGYNRRRRKPESRLDENGFPIESGRNHYVDYDYYDDYDDYDRYDRRDRPVIINKGNRNSRYDRRYIDNDIEVYRNENNYIAHHQRGRGGLHYSILVIAEEHTMMMGLIMMIKPEVGDG